MPTKRLLSALVKVATALALALVWVADASAGPKYKVLHAFTSGNDGSAPFAGLVLDNQDNLYGTTYGGGGSNYAGTVFELERSSGGRWTENVLHRFSYQVDGGYPIGGLVLDPAGNLYGAATSGGPNGVGTVFEMTRESGGWTLNVLDDHGSGADLILDKAGNLYGPIGPGKYGDGAITELTPGSDGWTENVLYSFCAQPHCIDGDGPYAGPIWDPAGNLYGTTQLGGKGSPDYGTAFEMKHMPDGTWQHILLHSFPSFPGDGEVVYAGLVLDGSGNL
jgi:uncharacterized repeat protein (TIGR03803 family)